MFIKPSYYSFILFWNTSLINLISTCTVTYLQLGNSSYIVFWSRSQDPTWRPEYKELQSKAPLQRILSDKQAIASVTSPVWSLRQARTWPQSLIQASDKWKQPFTSVISQTCSVWPQISPKKPQFISKELTCLSSQALKSLRPQSWQWGKTHKPSKVHVPIVCGMVR